MTLLMSCRFISLGLCGLPVSDTHLSLFKAYQDLLERIDLSFCYSVSHAGLEVMLAENSRMREVVAFGLTHASTLDEKRIQT